VEHEKTSCRQAAVLAVAGQLVQGIENALTGQRHFKGLGFLVAPFGANDGGSIP
jgi:hypothetical protein